MKYLVEAEVITPRMDTVRGIRCWRMKDIPSTKLMVGMDTSASATFA